MRKRERENPCGICGHYHKYEEGEVCGICGHRMPAIAEKSVPHASAFASEILPDFLYLGSYDNASRYELLKTQGISRILNTVSACQNIYKNSFTYHSLQGENLQFDDAIQFLEQCEKDKVRVLVHCMSGKSRSPAVVVAYLMKRKRWRLVYSYQWVKDRRPIVELSSAVYQLLQAYEQKIFGPSECSANSDFYLSESSLMFGFPKPNIPFLPTFNQSTASIFDRGPLNMSPHFTFGTGLNENNFVSPNESDTTME